MKTDSLLLTALGFKFLGFLFYDIDGLRIVTEPISLTCLGLYIFSNKKSRYNLIAISLSILLLSFLIFNTLITGIMTDFTLLFYIKFVYGALVGVIVLSQDVMFLRKLLKLIALFTLLRVIYVDIIFILTLIMGHDADGFVSSFSSFKFAWYDFSFKAARVSDQAVVFYPFVLYFIRKDILFVSIMTGILGFLAVLINFNAAGLVAFCVICMSYVFFQKKYFILFSILFGFIYTTVTYIEVLTFLFELKRYSFEVKLAQISYITENIGSFILGSGIGATDAALFRPGGFMIENSYLYLIYVFGVMAIPFFIYFSYLGTNLFLNLNNQYTQNLFTLYAVFVSILVLSASNPYLYSGSVYVVLYLLSKSNIKEI